MTQITTSGFQYVGVNRESRLSLQKITDQAGGEAIEITVWDGHDGHRVLLENLIADELLTDLGEMVKQ